MIFRQNTTKKTSSLLGVVFPNREPTLFGLDLTHPVFTRPFQQKSVLCPASSILADDFPTKYYKKKTSSAIRVIFPNLEPTL